MADEPAERLREDGEREYRFMQAARDMLQGDDWAAALLAKRAMPPFDLAVLAPDEELTLESEPLAELHPFRWDRIELVVPPAEDQVATETLSLAPLL